MDYNRFWCVTWTWALHVAYHTSLTLTNLIYLQHSVITHGKWQAFSKGSPFKYEYDQQQVQKSNRWGNAPTYWDRHGHTHTHTHTHTQKVSIFTRFSWGCLWRFRSCGTWRRVGGCAVPDVQPSPYCIHLRESRGSQVHTFVPPTPSLMVTTVPDTHVTETPYINISPNHPAFGILHGTRDPWRGRYSVLTNRPETLN